MAQIIDKVVYKMSHTVDASKTFTSANVDIVNDTVNVASHGFSTGDNVGLLMSGSVTGLTEATTAYYIIASDAHNIAFATSRANAIAGTKVDITAIGTGTTTISKYGLGISQLGVLPDNFIITDCWYDVVTTYVSDDGTTPGNDAGTIALSSGQAANDFKVAIAISDSTNVYDAGLHGTLMTAPNLGADAAHDTALEVIALETAIKLKLTADRTVVLTIATETLSAGSMDLFIEGYQGR